MGRPQGKIIVEMVRPNKVAAFETGKKLDWTGKAHNLESRGAWFEIWTQRRWSDWVNPSKLQDSVLNDTKTSAFAVFGNSSFTLSEYSTLAYRLLIGLANISVKWRAERKIWFLMAQTSADILQKQRAVKSGRIFQSV